MIEDIQKARFLNNLYKSYYAYGKKIDEALLKSLYAEYFSENPAGSPLQLYAENLRYDTTANVDIVNDMMAKAIFNMDVLYDASYEAIEDLYAAVSSLNNRIDSLRARRVKIEKTIDDFLFSITNTDGFYASFTEEFQDIDSIDVKYSTAYLDSDSRSISLPSLNSGAFNQVANNIATANNAKYSIFFNGQNVKTDTEIGPEASLMFDNLNDTYWKYTHRSNSPGICTMQLDISAISSSSISRIQGRISSDKKVNIIAQLSSTSSERGLPLYSKQSESDFDNFVFQFDPINVNSTSLFFVKNEPDRMIAVGNSVSYEYDFIIRDIIMSGMYFDTSAIYVSPPINISYNDNKKNVIDAVSIEVASQNDISNNVSYYVAKDNPDAITIDDFKWIPISPTNQENKSYSTVVSFNGSSQNYKTILENKEDSEFVLKNISKTTQKDIPGYENISICKVAKLNSISEQIVEPFILEGYNKFTWYKYKYESNLCENLSNWKNIIAEEKLNRIIKSTYSLGSTSSFWSAPSINEGGSVLIDFNIIVGSDLSIQKSLTKDDDNSSNWDMAIYLNGVIIKRIRPGIRMDNITWNFKKGANNVKICIDAQPKKSVASQLGLYGSFTLMQQSRISEYGFVYQNYMMYINNQLFRQENELIKNSFSIDKIDTINYIISNRPLVDGSRFYYTTTSDSSDVQSMRVRINMTRELTSPKASPIITSYKVKFKRSDSLQNRALTETSKILAPNNRGY